MKEVIVGFSKPKKWKPFAWLIMVGYGIPYDHVYVRFYSDSYQRDIIYQASKTMVNFMSPEVFKEENLVIKEFNIAVDDEDNLKMIQFAIDNAGKAYGVKAAIGLGIVRIFELFGKKIKNPFGDGTKTYVCSELVGYILDNYLGDNLNEDTNLVSPLDIYNFLMKKSF